MGWFDEQIKQRKENNDRLLAEAFVRITDSVLDSKMSVAYLSDEAKTGDAIGEILRYYKGKSQEIPPQIKTLEDRLEFMLRPYGIMYRGVVLSKGWHRDAFGAMLGRRKDDGSIVALIPSGLSGYSFQDSSTGKRVKITKKTELLFEDDAICFYRPMPMKKLNTASLIRYMAGCVDTADIVFNLMGGLLLSAIGLLSPALNNLLFGKVAASQDKVLLLSIALFMVCVSVSSLLLKTMTNIFNRRVNTKLNLSVQSATMMRILALPVDFFKKYSSGELYTRFQYLQTLCNMIVSALLDTGMTSLFSLIYITQIFVYAPALVIPSLMVILVTLLLSISSIILQARHSGKQLQLAAKESGMSYALISGIQKIKLSGAEQRAFARWADLYAQQVRMTYNPPMFLRLNGVLNTAISLTGSLVMYAMAMKSGVSTSEYYAFTTAYGMLSGAFLSLAGIATTLAQMKPVLDMARPIMETEPEVSEGKRVIEKLNGAIELNNVSFRYTDDMPLVLDDLTLKIRPGQYVGIVGSTGCGKSTLMRILLGFEKPQKGAVYYGGRDINTIDLKSLRRKIGVVMQDGKLFQGDIFSNITISAPRLTLNDAWEAAEMAGLAEDIRRMPMGMHTIISEGSGGISGGQRQRLLIARAIAPKPKILMFDEATSALDNLTQKTVSESLDKLKCTRIVIAHRLSTIRHCDRILYLEKGKILEDGSYEELIALNGKFAELVERQRLDT